MVFSSKDTACSALKWDLKPSFLNRGSKFVAKRVEDLSSKGNSRFLHFSIKSVHSSSPSLILNCFLFSYKLSKSPFDMGITHDTVTFVLEDN